MTSPDSHTAQSSFEALAESAPDAILTIDTDSVILSANPAVERIFGYAPAELIGQKLTVLIPARWRASHENGIARYLRTGRHNIPWTGVRLSGLHRSGHEFPVEVSFGEFVEEGGRRVFSGFVRDVSERVLAEAERTLRDFAIIADDDMLSTISHDLRNPMNAVVMSVSLLNDPEIRLTEEQRRVQLAVIARSVYRMNRLIQDLRGKKTTSVP